MMSLRSWWICCALLLAGGALAQTAALGSADNSRGTTLLPNSSAWNDEATATISNPASLGRVGRFNAWYLHERSSIRAQDNDGLFVATSIARWVGLGVSFEWLRPYGAKERAITSAALSLGPEMWSLGATLHWFHGSPSGGLTSLDVGAMLRPARWLSLSALARNLNQPHSDTATLAREWTLGLGLRPWGEHFSVGVDWSAIGNRVLADSRMQYTLQMKPLEGLRLLAGISHTFREGDPLYLHLGLGLDLEHVGYTQGVALAQGQVHWQFAARLSLDDEPSLIPTDEIAVFSVGDLGQRSGTTVGTLLGLEKEDAYLQFVRTLHLAAADPHLSGVVLKIEETHLGMARADEIRAAIAQLKAHGKKVFAYVMSATDVEYLMISGCTGIYAAPEAMWLVDGLQSSVTFFGGAAKRLGVDIEVARVGRWKNFPEQFTRPDMSDAQRETLSALLDTHVKLMSTRVADGRGIDAASWQVGVDEGLKPPQRALALRQLDGVMTPTEFDELLQREFPRSKVTLDYQPERHRDARWSTAKSIVIIPVLGSISGGPNTTAPITGEPQAGAQAFIATLEAAAEDPSVAAIIVRIDSGGGDGLASALMYEAILAAKEKKPIIASMGDVAASGGYYVAMGADTIVASPGTITGSIGVFYVKPVIQRLAEDWGINHQTLSRGARAGLTDFFTPWTPAQREAAQGWIDDFYDRFITQVSQRRHLGKEAVDAVAQGRVWSGEDALRHGLVDELGGLAKAIALAQAKTHTAQPLDIRIRQHTSGLLNVVLGAVAPATVTQMSVTPNAIVPAGLEAIAQQLGTAAWLLEKPRIQARLEYSVEIR